MNLIQKIFPFFLDFCHNESLHLQGLRFNCVSFDLEPGKKIKAWHPDARLFALHKVTQVVTRIPMENFWYKSERINTMNLRQINGGEYKQVFCRYVVKNGRKIYPKRAKYFVFWVAVDSHPKKAA